MFLGTALLVVVAWLSYRPALDRYHVWKQQRALGQARQFLSQKNPVDAALAIKVALNAVPGDPQALRMAAELLDSVGSPEVMRLRRQLVELDPDSVENRAALVNDALRFHDLNAARDALSEMTPAQANQPVALKAALAYAIATNNKPIADALFDRLQSQEPDNGNLKVMHALLRLHSPKADVVAEARRELETLARDPRDTLFIERQMMAEALGRHDMAAAKSFATKVMADPKATLNDRLNLANLELNVDRRPFDDVFAQVAPKARGNAADAAEFSHWLFVVGQAAKADQWIASLPADLQHAPAVLSNQADVVAALQQWDRLQDLLEAGAWGPVNKDTVRLAFATRLAVSRNNAILEKQIWDEATASAGKSLASLKVLYRLATAWRWDEQIESTLWAVTRAFPEQTWAHQSLFTVYNERKDTVKLCALMGTLHDVDPSVARYKHDWALLSLLLTRTLGWDAPKQAMQDLFTADPKNPTYALGYAYALAQADREKEALAVIAKIPPDQLALPTRAPYLAFIYGVCRQKPEFSKALALQSHLRGLLPEEGDLFAQGQDAVDRPVQTRAQRAKPPEKSDADSAKAPAAS
ncbi:MAG: hypothetical protein ACHQ4G_06480 [Opitutales bacterium]